MKFLTLVLLLISITYTGCHKKQLPQQAKATAKMPKNKAGKASVIENSGKKKTAIPLPKVIAVNDSVAKISVDGRKYYDLMGHRYWRNYKDGKYYLFNKSMFSDSAYKPHNYKKIN